MTVSFLRNKTVTVQGAADGALRVVWRLVDDLSEIEVELTVKPPDLSITAAEARINNHTHPGYAEVADALEKVVGVRIGPGLRKIVTGLLPSAPGADELVEAVLESCNAVILHFTLPHIRAGEKMSDEERREANIKMLEMNPRMLGSCVAWQPGSPLLEALGIETGGGS
jgi:hypothetical protein